MILRAAARSDVGMRRRGNEDRFVLVPEHGFYLVADGMGGHTAGQIASQLAAEAAARAIAALEGANATPAEKLQAGRRRGSGAAGAQRAEGERSSQRT